MRQVLSANDEKSIWEPCRRIDWFSLTWDSARGTLEIVDRCAKILGNVGSIVDCGFVISARNLASFTGQIISTSAVPETSLESWRLLLLAPSIT